MYLAGVLVLALSAVVLISAHPIEPKQDQALLNPEMIVREKRQVEAPSDPNVLQDQSQAEPATIVREKRTIGILRDLFPNFSQIIDRKIQMLTRIIFRIVGRLVLQGGGGGGGGGSDDDDRKISITLPTYPPDQLDDEDEDEDATATPVADSTDPTTNADSENTVNRKREVRSKRSPDDQAEEEEDLETDATGDNEVPSDNEAESDGEAIDEEDPRNKRFLNFNLGASADSAGGSGGGSGNFLFDIIRLVAGSGSNQGGDASHAAVEEGKEDVGVPGPLTRLFVVANKGVAALIQDLILRLAQTSERIVNFKAKLITSII